MFIFLPHHQARSASMWIKKILAALTITEVNLLFENKRLFGYNKNRGSLKKKKDTSWAFSNLAHGGNMIIQKQAVDTLRSVSRNNNNNS